MCLTYQTPAITMSPETTTPATNAAERVKDNLSMATNGQDVVSGLTEENLVSILNETPEAKQMIARLLDERINHLTQLRDMLGGVSRGRGRRGSNIIAANITDGLGHAEAIRKALRTNKKFQQGASATEIRDYLRTNGHPLPSGLFHSTMNSLRKSKEVNKTGKGEKAVFKPTASFLKDQTE